MRGRDVLSLAFRVIGAVFFAAAIGAGLQTLLFLRDSATARGVVVEHKTISNAVRFVRGDEPTGVLYYPVVQYDTEDGKTYRMTGRTGRTRPELATGATVAVRYSLSRPDDARVATVMGVWGSSLILAGCGVLFLVISLLTPLGFGGAARRSLGAATGTPHEVRNSGSRS